MKKNLFYVLIAMVLTTASCAKDGSDNISVAEKTVKIVASIASQTRAPQLTDDGSGTFSEGDKMSLFVTDDEKNIFSVDYAYGSGLLTWGSLGFSESDVPVTLAACYPQQKEIKNGLFEFNTFTASDKDLLIAPVQSVKVGTSETVYLKFSHALHLLELTFVAGDNYTEDDLKSFSLTLKAKTTCVVDGNQGKIKEVKDDIAEYSSDDTETSFYLVPQPTGDIILNIGIGSDKKTITLDKLLEQLGTPQSNLEGGKRCQLTLKVSKEGITVEGGSINGWGDQVTADGEVVIG